MVILLVNLVVDTLRLEIYKIYRNKKIVPELLIKVNDINEKDIHLKIDHSNKVNVVDKLINFKPGQPLEDKLKRIFQHEKLIKYEFDYIINKIKFGGTQYTDITLLHSKIIADLIKINNSAQQKLQLDISGHCSLLYKKAKHYLCFDSGFYSTVTHTLPINTALTVNNEVGLYLAAISSKLTQYTPKAKKSWLIITIEEKHTLFTLIKKQQCLSSYQTKLSIFEDDGDTVNRGNCLKIAELLAQILTGIPDIHGLVITGSVGFLNNKIRKSIFKSLLWSGITINTKSTNYLISKKSSTLPIICINAHETDAILAQLSQRI